MQLIFILIQDVSDISKRLWHSRDQINIRRPGDSIPTLGGTASLL